MHANRQSVKSGNNYKIIIEKDWQCVSCALCAIVNNPRPIRHLCIHTWHASSTLCQRRSVGTGPGFTILNISTNFPSLLPPPPFLFYCHRQDCRTTSMAYFHGALPKADAEGTHLLSCAACACCISRSCNRRAFSSILLI